MSVITLGSNIRRLRVAAGYKTQGDLAKAMGVPQPQVSDWENDRYAMLDTKTLMRIGTQLKVSMDRLVEGLDIGYDLVCQSGTRSSAVPPEEVADVPASARRVAELERLVADYESRFSEMQDVASRLVKLAALGSAEEREAARAAPTRRRGNRKAG